LGGGGVGCGKRGTVGGGVCTVWGKVRVGCGVEEKMCARGTVNKEGSNMVPQEGVVAEVQCAAVGRGKGWKAWKKEVGRAGRKGRRGGVGKV